MGIFAWHTNRRNYDRDRESIHREAEALATELRAELQLESQAEMKRIADSLADREQSIRETIERAFAPKLASVGARIDRVEEEALSLRHDALEREAEEALASGRYARAIERYCSLLNIQVKRDMDKYLTGYVLDKLREIAKSPKAILDAETVTLVAKTLAELPTRHHAACEPLVALFKGKLA